jgi:hypothetical protein
MGELADRLGGMRVRASVPGGAVSAELRGRSELFVEFAPGYYRRVDDRSLEQALTVLCRLLWAAHEKEYQAIIRRAGGVPMTRERVTDPLDVDYCQRLDELTAVGTSADGRVRVSVRGMREWAVRVDAVSLREREFVSRAAEAAEALINDQFEKVLQLRQQVFNSRSGPKVA